MKKFLCLMLLMLATPVFAQSYKVTRFQKELNDVILKCTNTQNTAYTCLLAQYNAISGDYIWRPGWSQNIVADVIPSVGQKGPITPPLTGEEEKANAEMMQYGLLQVYGKTLNYYRQYPEFNTKFTQEQIKKVRGY